MEANKCINKSLVKSPLLFFLGELSGETKHGFVDPIARTLNGVDTPQLNCQIECLSSRFGWLLLLSRETSSLFFFNPLTIEKLLLPYRKSVFNAVAFSAPPTSPHCTVYAVVTPTFDTQICIDTFCVGKEDQRWLRHVYRVGGSLIYNVLMQAVCCNGVLYCIDSAGTIAIFDAEASTLSVPTDQEAQFEGFYNPYLLEFNGEVFAGTKGPYGVLEKLYKLKLDNEVGNWVEVKDLRGLTLFLGPYGSCALSWSNIADGVEMNKLFIARDRPDSKCVIYNVFNGCECKQDTSFDATPFSSCYAPVWIERSSLSCFDGGNLPKKPKVSSDIVVKEHCYKAYLE